MPISPALRRSSKRPRNGSSSKTWRIGCPPPRPLIWTPRARTGEKLKTLSELLDLMTRAAHEQELFVPADWEFIQWLAENRSEKGARGQEAEEMLILPEVELLHWLARWGQTGRLQLNGNTQGAIEFRGEIAE